ARSSMASTTHTRTTPPRGTLSLQGRRHGPERAHVLGLRVLIWNPVRHRARIAGSELRLVDRGDPHLAARRAFRAGDRVAVVARAEKQGPVVAAGVVRAEVRQEAVARATARGIEPDRRTAALGDQEQ